MAQRITEEIIDHVSILAKLSLNDDERKAACEDMQIILDHIGKLDELDTSDIEPMTSTVNLCNVFREDIVTGTDMHETILANAPGKYKDQFVVPKTTEG